MGAEFPIATKYNNLARMFVDTRFYFFFVDSSQEEKEGKSGLTKTMFREVDRFLMTLTSSHFD